MGQGSEINITTQRALAFLSVFLDLHVVHLPQFEFGRGPEKRTEEPFFAFLVFFPRTSDSFVFLTEKQVWDSGELYEKFE